MPSASNSNYCFGAKRRTIRSIGIKAIMATALLAITVVGRASVDEVARWNQIATDATTAANTNPSPRVVSLRFCTLQFTMP